MYIYDLRFYIAGLIRLPTTNYVYGHGMPCPYELPLEEEVV